MLWEYMEYFLLKRIICEKTVGDVESSVPFWGRSEFKNIFIGSDGRILDIRF